MNILHTETLYNWGGEQNKVMNEMRFMRELGHEVYLFCNPNSEILKVAKSENFNTIECEMNKKNFHKSIPALCKAIKENSINVVITHASTDSWVGAIAGLLWRKRGVKFLRERHNMFPIKGIVSKFMHKKMFDKILYISQSVFDTLKSIGIKEQRLFYLPSTIDTKLLKSIKSTFREEQNISPNDLVIGTFTSLYRKKGVYDFATAAKEILKTFKDATIVFGGNINESVKADISSMFSKDEKIIFTGFRKDGINVIKSYDIYVFASHSEGLGTVLLEAMSSQTPIVVYDKEPMSVLIKDKSRGLCAKFQDTSSLTQNIINLINDKNIAQSYAQNALKYVEQNYDHKVLKQQIKILLESL
ncbi:glycosyltransferase family 4 protein [Campylobacter curvus]|uniref:glycosyltransferase family 4 protein n=1 Tax=Campylobacter curvus TaxID=200 RepID=UPI0003658F1F|nr:glycosyltransferase family 4 protein [Campylobacter curvus]QKF60705.1 glycosyltransferase, family 1 [Campylobacter curvus]UEB49031.1 glycosyltransferase family 4 protein [Campylobacter curvus]